MPLINQSFTASRFTDEDRRVCETVGVRSDRRHFLLNLHLPIRATAQRRPFSLCPAKITKVAVLEGSTVLTPFTQPVNLDCPYKN